MIPLFLQTIIEKGSKKLFFGSRVFSLWDSNPLQQSNQNKALTKKQKKTVIISKLFYYLTDNKVCVYQNWLILKYYMY